MNLAQLLALPLLFTLSFIRVGFADDAPQYSVVRLGYQGSVNLSLDEPMVSSVFALFDDDCTFRGEALNPSYNSCALRDLFNLYKIRHGQVAELMQIEFSARDSWNFSDLIAGAFNLRLTMEAKHKSVKPLVDLLAIHFALNNELKIYKRFLDGQGSDSAQLAKRIEYPRLMAFFGGITPMGKMGAFADALSCDFWAHKPGTNTNSNECQAVRYDIQNSLKKLSRTSLPDTQKLIEAIKSVADKPELQPSASIAQAVVNSQLLFDRIAKMKTSDILTWATNDSACAQNLKESRSLTNFCKRLNSSLDRPEDISNPQLIQAIISAVGLYETSKVLKASSTLKGLAKPPVAISQFPQGNVFIQEAREEISTTLIHLYSAILEHYLQYDPTQIIEPGFEQRTLWER